MVVHPDGEDAVVLLELLLVQGIGQTSSELITEAAAVVTPVPLRESCDEQRQGVVLVLG